MVPQAMAAGLPLIATATDGTPEAVRDGDTGWLVAPADPAALADRMERFLADPARARAMGARGRERVDEFSAERMVERLEQLYAAPGRGLIPRRRAHEPASRWPTSAIGTR